jgi:hypothetical protein
MNAHQQQRSGEAVLLIIADRGAKFRHFLLNFTAVPDPFPFGERLRT